MTLGERIAVILQLLRWRATWNRFALDHRPDDPDLDPRFMTAREAAERVPDGAVGISGGMAGNARCGLMFRAIRERFRATGHPRGLTWIAVGGQGGRGRAPGTVEELGEAGLVTRFVSGHVETVKSMLQLAAAGQLELHVLPQGEMTAALDGQASGQGPVNSRTGIGTFLDPRCGRGSPVVPEDAANLVRVGEEALQYTLPNVDLAVFNAPWADREGNVYFRDAATITENLEAARAARRNGGLVIAQVAGLIDPDAAAVDVPRDLVDAVVVDPRAEQTILSRQRQPWRLFCPGGDGDDHAAEERLRFVNRLLSITPRRGPVEEALARLGAYAFARNIPLPATVNVGVGFAEEVCREVYESALGDEVIFTTETGVYGGLPAPGIYFGAAVNPRRIESSTWMFRHYRDHLDAALLGFLEFDAEGHVNVSRRGDAVTDYVGPGGFPSITHAARSVIFIGRWMHGATWRIENESLVLAKPGRPKLLPTVGEITFNGREALADGKQVLYVTTVGIFRLTRDGLLLETLMPGIDLDRDVLSAIDVPVRLPPGGPEVAPASVVSGRGFDLGELTEQTTVSDLTLSEGVLP